MKHIKTYEELKIGVPQAGDYVIAEIPTHIAKFYDIDYVNFIQDNIGIIIVVNTKEHYVGIEYEQTVPGNNLNVNYTYLNIKLVKYLSKNKEDLETILASNKYNI